MRAVTVNCMLRSQMFVPVGFRVEEGAWVAALEMLNRPYGVLGRRRSSSSYNVGWGESGGGGDPSESSRVFVHLCRVCLTVPGLTVVCSVLCEGDRVVRLWRLGMARSIMTLVGLTALARSSRLARGVVCALAGLCSLWLIVFGWLCCVRDGECQCAVWAGVLGCRPDRV